MPGVVVLPVPPVLEPVLPVPVEPEPDVPDPVVPVAPMDDVPLPLVPPLADVSLLLVPLPVVLPVVVLGVVVLPLVPAVPVLPLEVDGVVDDVEPEPLAPDPPAPASPAPRLQAVRDRAPTTASAAIDALVSVVFIRISLEMKFEVRKRSDGQPGCPGVTLGGFGFTLVGIACKHL